MTESGSIAATGNGYSIRGSIPNPVSAKADVSRPHTTRVAISFAISDARRVELSAGEVTGAVGDSITVLPIVVAMAALTDVSLPHVLLAFGVFQIVWGFGTGSRSRSNR